MSTNINDNQIFLLYAVPTYGLTDPQEIGKKAIENGELYKCPIYTEDGTPATAVALFQQANPDYLVTGISDLQTLKEEINYLEEYKKSIPNQE